MTSRLFARRGWILALLFLILLAARFDSDARLRPEWLIYIAAAIALRLWAGAHLGDHGNGHSAQAPRLAHTGPYRLSRNPLYIANILAAAGLVFYANALPLPAELVLVTIVILHHIVLVRHEEKTLRALFSETYARYAALTPRWYGLMRPQGLKPTEQSNERVGVTLSTLWRRQGRNVVYMVLCVLAVWVTARW